MADTGTITGLDTAAGLANAKQMLANGYILNYATDIYQWKYSTLSNDPATTAVDRLFATNVPASRRTVCTHLNSSAGSSGHGMTIVGYNDEAWGDLNKHGVVDPGKKGAFRIANSWGTGRQNGGDVWVAYGALKAVSAVTGGRHSPPFRLNEPPRSRVRFSVKVKVLDSITPPTETWSQALLSVS